MLIKKQYFIKEEIKHSNYLKTFVFEKNFNASPGQFAMVFIPGVGEKPFSLSGMNQLTFEKRGKFTNEFFDFEPGDFVYVREPLGVGFAEGNYTAIAGGSGIAPLMHLISAGKVDSLLYGARDKEHLILDLLEQKTNVTYATDDGSYKHHGFVTDLIDESLPLNSKFAICGPELMMKNSAEKLVELGVDPNNIFLSLERYMKCGEGLCGSCEISGRRVCVDGPVFEYAELLDMPDFAKSVRTKSGRKIN